ncbi:hypothetical protein NE237_027455 [Protea cynaroides]|uniref:BHLH domain-containing protein n=1 Tax=Protea cynaroides TaxID=273540 RepID=A0A9Q0GN10_9MAGN|nr:hypothetical protein NE237_027455 [Protea cynaroides]
MERLRGPINPCYFGVGEHFNEELLERGCALAFTQEPFMDSKKLRREEEGQPLATSTQNTDEKMSFLQMLRSVESSSFIDPNFQFLLRQQQLQNQTKPELDFRNHPLELESCISNEISEAQSAIQSESKDSPQPQSSSCLEVEVMSSACRGERNSPEKCGEGSEKSPPSNKAGPASSNYERRKRKRMRPSKNKEEVESQRMTHIAVERNRRRQMNNHFDALRSLMPTSFIQKGDQASIVGGAIEFVKELEQLLQSLESQKKRMTQSEGQGQGNRPHSEESIIPLNGFFASPQYRSYSSFLAAVHSSSVVGSSVDDDVNRVNEYMEEEEEGGEKLKTENTVAVALAATDIKVIVIQRHVNLKILSPRRRPRQLLRAIATLEDLKLTILHLDITSARHSVLYSFNLKMEDDCELGSAEDIATAVHQTFNKALEDKYAATSLAFAGAIGLWVSTGMISAIYRVPIVPGVLELVGIGYSELEKEAQIKGIPLGQALDIDIPPPRPARKPSNPYPRKTSTGAPMTSRKTIGLGE